jgi:hypothetical protein
MSRFKKLLTPGLDLAYLISVGFLALICPRKVIDRALSKFEKGSRRIRLLPAHAVVYFVLALVLWRDPPQEEVLRIVCQNMDLLMPGFASKQVPSKGAITKARIRLGFEVLEDIAKNTLKPIAPIGAIGSWYKDKRLMSFDGSCFSLPDSRENAKYFGYPPSGRGDSAFPSMRVLSLVELGTHIVAAAEIGPFNCSEQALTSKLIDSNCLTSEMLVLADRNFYGYNLWSKAIASGADLLWRAKSNLNFPVEKRLSDGSYITTVRSSKDKKNSMPLKIRVIEYKLTGKNLENEDEVYRLVTSLSNHKKYPAFDLATLYHQRWEIEILFKEVKSSLNNNNSVLRSHKSDLVKQEMWAVLITHYAVRQVMAKTAWDHNLDPLKLSFQGSIHILRRKIPQVAVFPPSGD